jgi:hypothetical protein
MAVSPFQLPAAAAAPRLGHGDVVENEEGEGAEPDTKCGRCRLTFVRHPSISAGDAPRWWLCPPCRSRLLGDEARTSSRWSS